MTRQFFIPKDLSICKPEPVKPLAPVRIIPSNYKRESDVNVAAILTKHHSAKYLEELRTNNARI